jgi:hypothetical protein
VEAIRADEDVRTLFPAIRESSGHPRGTLCHREASMAAMNAIGIHPASELIEKISSMHTDRGRRSVFRLHFAPGQNCQHISSPGALFKTVHDATGCQDSLGSAKHVQGSETIGPKSQPRTDFAQLIGLLENQRFNADTRQGDGGGKAPDTPADNDSFHRVLCMDYISLPPEAVKLPRRHVRRHVFGIQMDCEAFKKELKSVRLLMAWDGRGANR